MECSLAVAYICKIKVQHQVSLCYKSTPFTIAFIFSRSSSISSPVVLLTAEVAPETPSPETLLAVLESLWAGVEAVEEGVVEASCFFLGRPTDFWEERGGVR